MTPIKVLVTFVSCTHNIFYTYVVNPTTYCILINVCVRVISFIKTKGYR